MDSRLSENVQNIQSAFFGKRNIQLLKNLIQTNLQKSFPAMRLLSSDVPPFAEIMKEAFAAARHEIGRLNIDGALFNLNKLVLQMYIGEVRKRVSAKQPRTDPPRPEITRTLRVQEDGNKPNQNPMPNQTMPNQTMTAREPSFEHQFQSGFGGNSPGGLGSFSGIGGGESEFGANLSIFETGNTKLDETYVPDTRSFDEKLQEITNNRNTSYNVDQPSSELHMQQMQEYFNVETKQPNAESRQAPMMPQPMSQQMMPQPMSQPMPQPMSQQMMPQQMPQPMSQQMMPQQMPQQQMMSQQMPQQQMMSQQMSQPQMSQPQMRVERDDDTSSLKMSYMNALQVHEKMTELMISERDALDAERKRIGVLVSSLEKEESNLRTLISRYNNMVFELSETQELARSGRRPDVTFHIDSRTFDNPYMSKYSFPLENEILGATSIELTNADFGDIKYNIWSDFTLAVRDVGSTAGSTVVVFRPGRWTVYDLIEHFNKSTKGVRLEIDDQTDRLRICSTSEVDIVPSSYWNQLGFDTGDRGDRNGGDRGDRNGDRNGDDRGEWVISATRTYDLRISQYVKLFIYNLSSTLFGRVHLSNFQPIRITFSNPVDLTRLDIGICDDVHERPITSTLAHSMDWKVCVAERVYR
jgi:hypothetical protein